MSKGSHKLVQYVHAGGYRAIPSLPTMCDMSCVMCHQQEVHIWYGSLMESPNLGYISIEMVRVYIGEFTRTLITCWE